MKIWHCEHCLKSPPLANGYHRLERGVFRRCGWADGMAGLIGLHVRRADAVRQAIREKGELKHVATAPREMWGVTIEENDITPRAYKMVINAIKGKIS